MAGDGSIIGNGDIEGVARAFRIDIDSEREAILRDHSTKDIRACPGSGKTTLLVAKMAMLSKEWRYQHRGICVLSHTNVAKDEIVRRFTDFPSLSNLTSYPHFIGTIQSFIDHFFGIPSAVRLFNARPSRIDNDFYRYELLHEFYGTAAYGTVSAALRAAFKNNGEQIVDYLVKKVVFADHALELPPQGFAGKPWDANTQSYKELLALKMALARRAVFTYEDMIALAERYLIDVPNLLTAVASRFPIVFIDEMQDTSARRANVLDQIFKRGSVMQRFGDDRQAIFSEEGNAVASRPFPDAGHLGMAKSYRLSPAVCNLAFNVVCSTPEALIGNTGNQDGRHTIFVFSSASVDRVLASFAELVASDVGVGLPAKEVRAVGGTVKCQASRIPSGVGDYMPTFNRAKKAKASSLNTLHAHLKLAQHAVITLLRVSDAREIVIDGVIRLLKEQRYAHPDVELHTRSFITSLVKTFPSEARALECALASLILGLEEWDGSNPSIGSPVVDIVASISGAPWNTKATAFICTVDATVVNANASVTSTDNIFRWESGQGAVEVLVDTIHSIKGETVKAILVLETFVYSHDLGKLIEMGYLTGKRPSKEPGVRVAEHVKKVFVAMTRPTTLLCLAICREHISDEACAEMSGLGWRVQSL